MFRCYWHEKSCWTSSQVASNLRLHGRIRQCDLRDTGQIRQREHHCLTPRTSRSVVPVKRHKYSPVYREWQCYYCGGLWGPIQLFSIFIGNHCKHKTNDIWHCTNEDQCVPDKPGHSCRTTTQGVQDARQGCWCYACQSGQPMWHESYCWIRPMMSRWHHCNENGSIMMTSSNGNIFHVTGLLCREFTGHRWIPRTKTSDAELWCCLWFAPE